MEIEETSRPLESSGKKKKHVLAPQDLTLELDEQGELFFYDNVKTRAQNQFKPVLGDLNWLFRLNYFVGGASSGGVELSDALIENKLKQTVKNVSKFIFDNKKIRIHLGSPILEQFFRIISLLVANNEIDTIIKTNMDSKLISCLLKLYLHVLNIFKDFEFDLNYKYSGDLSLTNKQTLLTQISLINPLLIAISCAFKPENSVNSNQLINILALIFTYLLKNQILIKSVLDSFIINNSTNMAMFQAFNKLWEKTLNHHIELEAQKQQKTYLPGPISILNRIDAINTEAHDLSLVELNQIFPYKLSSYVYELSESLLKIYSNLVNIEHNSNLLISIDNLLLLVNTDFNCELLIELLNTFNLTDHFMSLLKQASFKHQLNYILIKLSNYQHLIKFNSSSYILRTSVFLNHSLTALKNDKKLQYKILLEVNDHNYKINFQKEYPIVTSLVNSLIFINNSFEFFKDHLILSEIGCYLTLPKIFTNVSDIISDSLVKFVNPAYKKTNLLVNKFNYPPLPKSSFLYFNIENLNKISEVQLNIKNFNILNNCVILNLLILTKVLNNYITYKVETSLEIKDLNQVNKLMEIKSVNLIINDYFKTFFNVLVLVNEYCIKSNKNNKIYYDLNSIASLLKNIVTKLISKVFKIFSSFAILNFLNFIDELSDFDLSLQKISIGLLNHFIFHSHGNQMDLKMAIMNNKVLKLKLTHYVNKWNDGSSVYRQFERLLSLPPVNYELVLFNIGRFQRLLGYEVSHKNDLTVGGGNASAVENAANSSPLSSSSSNLVLNTIGLNSLSITAPSTTTASASNHDNSSIMMNQKNTNSYSMNYTKSTMPTFVPQTQLLSESFPQSYQPALQHPQPQKQFDNRSLYSYSSFDQFNSNY